MYVYVTYSVNFFKLFFFLFKSRFVWNLETLLITERGITDLYIWVFINQSWQNLIIHNLYTANVSSLVPDGVQDVREIQSFISNCTTIHFFHGNKFCIKVHSVLVAFHKKLGCWLRFSKGETENISKTMYSWDCTNHVLQLPDMDELFFVKRSC